MSIFALTVDDGMRVLEVIDGFDAGDPFARAAPDRAAAEAAPKPLRLGVLAPNAENVNDTDDDPSAESCFHKGSNDSGRAAADRRRAGLPAE